MTSTRGVLARARRPGRARRRRGAAERGLDAAEKARERVLLRPRQVAEERAEARPEQFGGRGEDVAAGVVAALGALDLGFAGAGTLGTAVRSAWPMLALLVGTLSVSALAVRRGAAELAATQLAQLARGSATRLLALVCLACALLTACLTLDGAVVLLAPVVVDLDRRFGAPRRPLLLGVVAVANACSAAVPTGNPTNLVILGRLDVGLGPGDGGACCPRRSFAAALCAAAVAVAERGALRTRLHAAREQVDRSHAGFRGLASVARIGLQIGRCSSCSSPRCSASRSARSRRRTGRLRR